jgi:hypothetical protein
MGNTLITAISTKKGKRLEKVGGDNTTERLAPGQLRLRPTSFFVLCSGIAIKLLRTSIERANSQKSLTNTR